MVLFQECVKREQLLCARAFDVPLSELVKPLDADTGTISDLLIVAATVDKHFPRFLNHLKSPVSNLFQITSFQEYAGRCQEMNGRKQ